MAASFIFWCKKYVNECEGKYHRNHRQVLSLIRHVPDIPCPVILMANVAYILLASDN